MSDALSVGTLARQRGRRVVRRPAVGYGFRIVLPLLIVSAAALAIMEPDYRQVAFPVVVMFNVFAIYVAVLWNRDQRLPVFEIGSLWVAATLVYSSMPFLGFMAMGLQWGPRVDGRLFAYRFDLGEITAFAWRYVLYMVSFVVIYLVVRGKKSAQSIRLNPVPRTLIAALLTILVFQYGFKWAMYVGYGLNPDISYAAAGIGQPTGLPPMPYFLLQITYIVLASVLVVKQGLLIILFRRWASLRWRVLLVAWMALEVLGVVTKMGERGSAVRLLLTAAVLYHRFVKPLRPLFIAGGATVLLSTFLALGLLRANVGVNELGPKEILTQSNEFQALFATAYDIHQRKVLEILPPVPWQVYVSDLYLLIPSQLLPFYKMDPSEWYLDVINARGSGVGFMFGVMAQAVLGLDWLELIIRGVILSLCFALFHRWYVRYAADFWVTLLYVFVTVWSYYTFRATSFWFMHYVVYQFVPVVLAAKLLTTILRRGTAAARVPATSS